MKTITLEFLQNEFGENITGAKLFIDSLIKPPIKPDTNLINDFELFQELFKKYEEDLKEFYLQRTFYYDNIMLLEQHIKNLSGLYRILSTETSRERVFYKALSYSFDGVKVDYALLYNKLCDLVSSLVIRTNEEYEKLNIIKLTSIQL